jgi:uncharacterized membrane protein HdeD (DUF308 family)
MNLKGGLLMTEKLKNLRNQTLILALAYIVIGLFFMLAPNLTLKTISILIAVFALIVSVVLIVSYFAKKEGTGGSLTGGLILIFFALFAFIKPDILAAAIFVLLGFAILINGSLKLETGLTLRKEKNKNAAIVLIAALVTIILGLIVLFATFGATALIIMIGISMILAGAFDLISMLFLIKKNKIDQNQTIDIN